MVGSKTKYRLESNHMKLLLRRILHIFVIYISKLNKESIAALRESIERIRGSRGRIR